MRCLLLLLLLPVTGFAQTLEGTGDKSAEKQNAAVMAEYNTTDSINTITYRRFSIGVTPGVYIPFNIPANASFFDYVTRTAGLNFTWRPDNRNKRLMLNADLENPRYEGTKLLAGLIYMPARENEKFTPYFGLDYGIALGSLSTDQYGTYQVTVGRHNYIFPFFGVKYKPLLRKASPHLDSIMIRERFFFKFEVGYSYLFTPLHVDTTGVVQREMYDIVTKTVLDALNVTIEIAYDIPSKKRKKVYRQYFAEMKEQNEFNLK